MRIGNIQLQSTPKWGKDRLLSRVVSPQETYRRIQPLMPLIEVTRIAELTGLDQFGLSVFAAVRPCADVPGNQMDYGKGPTKIDACVSAMMEAIERSTLERLNCTPTIGTFEQISHNYNALDPRLMHLYSTRHMLIVRKILDERAITLDWIPATDLLREEDIMVPANFVCYPFHGRGAEYWFMSASGVASGNIMEEAVCHGLHELIERDALTLAVITSFPQLISSEMSTLQLLKQQFSSMRGKREDPFNAIALESLPAPVDTLAKKIHHAGFHLCLKDITSDIGIASFGAALSKPTENYFPTVGFGAHPNAKVAAIRAITEVILNHNFTLTDVSQKTYTRPKGTFWWAHAPSYKNFSEVPSYEHDDIMDDVNLMISRLKECGISRLMAVDLTQSNLGIPVLRLIAPELECWCLTYFQGETRIGFRGRKLLT